MNLVIPSKHRAGGLEIDESVFSKLKSLALKSRSGVSLRVSVLGGGCSGFQYDFSLSQKEPDDFVVCVDFEGQSLEVCVDPVSDPFLHNARLIYQSDMAGSRFQIDNPNATASCGCGISFSV